MMLRLNNLLLAGLIIFNGSLSLAYKVKDISGKKILIDLEGEKLFEGDTVMSINKTIEGPEIAGSAKVLQVRDKQAIALISDGKFVIGKKIARKASDTPATSAATPGGSAAAATATKKSVVTKAEPEYAEDEEIYETSEQRRERMKNATSDGIVFRRDMLKVALIGSFTSDRIWAKQADDTLPFPVEETVPMEGSSSGIGLSFDYPSQWGVTLRGVVLSEKVSVYGKAVDNNVCAARTSSDCLANITYLSTGGHLRFDYNISRFTFWAAGGMVFKFPTAKETTSLRTEAIKTANALVGSGGFDFTFNNRFFMPFAFEYHYSLNKSDSVPIIDHSAFMVGFGAKF